MKPNINTAEYWDKVYNSEGQDTWRIYPTTVKLITKLASENKTIIELGCGVGILTNKLRRLGHHVLGIDISTVACIKTGEPYLNISVPPILQADNSFDVIVAAEFLEHITDRELLLEECARVSKKAIFVVPNNTLGPDECPEHQIAFNEFTLHQLLNKYYSDVTVISYRDTFDKISIPCLLAIAENK